MTVDFSAIAQAVMASNADILDARVSMILCTLEADGPGLIEVRIVTRRPITFGDEVWLAANDAASDANPLVDARVVEATWA